jgi:hypothetical protein
LTRGRRPSIAARAAALWLGLAVAIALAACGVGPQNAGPVTFPPQSFGASGPSSGAAAATRAVVAKVLGTQRFQLRDVQAPVRPPESPRLGQAPRLVVQAVLPDDPNHGFISIYEFPDDAAAAEAGREQATYIASGPGRVQFTADTRFVLRQLGQTVVFYTWSPGGVADAEASDIQRALETIGTGIAIPG